VFLSVNTVTLKRRISKENIIMKQERHSTLINRDTGNSDNLVAAKKKKFDEFYTPLSDVKAELNHYKHRFKGKNIICPCDWDVLKDEDVYSVTIEFDTRTLGNTTYTINKVKRVKLQHFNYQDIGLSVADPEPIVTEEVITGEEAQRLLGERVTCNFVKYLLGIAGECQIKSITASGYDGINNRGIKFQEIDYSQYDLCLTNPPFSIYKEFITCMMEEYSHRDRDTNPFDFIVLAPLMNRVAPCVCEHLMERRLFLGYTRDTHVWFLNPDEKAEHNLKKSVDIDWLTTFPDAQNEVDKYLLCTGVFYDVYKDEYSEMSLITCKDGTHPIKINDKRVIPEDYTGWMACSSGVLNKLSNKYYEWHMLSCQGYYNSKYPERSPLTHKISPEIFEGGFNGIVLLRRNDVPYEEVDNA
jgi:hypothetical protein